MSVELPVVRELVPPPDVQTSFVRLSRRSRCVFLDSALRHQTLGRYSYLVAEPIETLEISSRESMNAFEALEKIASRFHATHIPALPHFQGGIVGLFAYDLNRQLERVPAPQWDEFDFPALSIGVYDMVLAWDHVENQAWIISHGFPEQDENRRKYRAQERIDQFESWLTDDSANLPRRHEVSRLELKQLAPQFSVNGQAGVTSNFSREAYLAAVQKCIDYIYAGDIFQVNLAQRLLHPATDDAVDLYLRLRERNPAPFAAYADFGFFQIASASPERFLSIRDRQIETRPIKGTRRRSLMAEADLFTGDELLESEKDRAENVMIVDLLRNDLARVCRPESVQVTQLCGLETYEFVQHLVSVVTGELKAEHSALAAVQAAFPGGSITGAPKVRAMEIIAELEPTARGPYCGSMGYIGFDGTMDLNILIRTIAASRGWWQFPVGGGIVAQSDPVREYDETWHKAEGLLRAIAE